MAAVGIAAHEVGHAIQHAHGYLPLVIRNAAVPAATFGPVLFTILVIVGMLLSSPKLILLGLAAYGALLVFELVNLPVEFDASNRAKRVLSELNIVDGEGALAVRDVLNAAGWTYVAATLQTLLTLLYYVLRFTGLGRSDND
jgi:Zn-dependent membrane protease YugP